MFDPKRVTLKQLRALAAVDQHGSVTAAAQLLNVTPPAISLQLRLLEENAGLPLLERGPAGFTATQAGREILVVGRRTEAGLAVCSEALAAMSGGAGGGVSIGIVSTAKYFAPRALSAFSKKYPLIDLKLRVGNRNETIRGLDDMEMDFALMGRPPNGDDYDHLVVGPHPHIVIAAPDHRFAGRRRLKFAALGEEKFLLREEGSGTRILMQRLLAEAGLNPRIGMEIGSNETIKQAVMAGIGIALLSAHTVSVEIEQHRLARLAVAGTPVIREWNLVRRTERRMLPSAVRLWTFLADHAKDFLPEVKR